MDLNLLLFTNRLFQLSCKFCFFVVNISRVSTYNLRAILKYRINYWPNLVKRHVAGNHGCSSQYSFGVFCG